MYRQATHAILVLSTYLVIAALGWGANAQGAGGELPFIQHQNPAASSGQCLPALQVEASEVLEQSQIVTMGRARPEEVAAIAQVVQALENIGSEQMTAHRQTRLRLNASPGRPSRHEGGIILLNGSRQANGRLEISNPARIAMMFGYRAGWKDDNYVNYMRQVRRPCRTSSFAIRDRSRRAEFAEVFSAYVTNPDLLKNSNSQPQCQEALEFMATLFGENAAESLSCESRKAAITASLNQREGGGTPSGRTGVPNSAPASTGGEGTQ